jgi:hypothetical protein
MEWIGIDVAQVRSLTESDQVVERRIHTQRASRAEGIMKHFAITVLVVIAVAFACSSGGPSGPTGNTVIGPLDTHCTLADGGVIAQETDPDACHPPGSEDAGTAEYGPTRYNSESDDDDCKYHVRFSSTAIRERQDVNFTVTATRKTDGTLVTGANVITLPDVFLSETHPAPNTRRTTSEGPPGTYKIGPVRFDAPGRWTTRIHLYEECADVLETSQHGHAAFYIDVP